VAVRSTRLLGPSLVNVGSPITYTSPDGVVTLIKYMTFAFNGADLLLIQHDAGTGSFTTMMRRTGAGANTSQEVEAFIVALSGEKLRFQNSGTNTIVVALFGAQLVVT
jgi:hypothetical protein